MEGELRCGGAVMHADLGKDIGHMYLHCAGTEREPVSNLVVPQTGRHQSQDLHLTRGQAGRIGGMVNGITTEATGNPIRVGKCLLRAYRDAKGSCRRQVARRRLRVTPRGGKLSTHEQGQGTFM